MNIQSVIPLHQVGFLTSKRLLVKNACLMQRNNTLDIQTCIYVCTYIHTRYTHARMCMYLCMHMRTHITCERIHDRCTVSTVSYK